ncbi:MAG: class I SAM-dependent methyltransferase [Methanomicrobiales archaeon]|nr:class I SAM-dependent methyltransferase [Methanomicrobiales archaeon]
MTTPAFECRSCGHREARTILDLGFLPLPNRLVSEREANHPDPRYPLELVYCPHCSLVQIRETVDPELLFTEYLYFSSFSETMLDHARRLCRLCIGRLSLSPESRVVEVASNDGYLLQYFLREGIPVLGIEPARNIARVAVERGIPTRAVFFGSATARELAAEGEAADLILGLNVLAHVPDLHGFIDGIRCLLKPGGAAVFEFPYVRSMIEGNEFDTIYHEHLCYFSLSVVAGLFRRHGLAVFDAEKIPIHGGSLRIFVCHAGTRPEEESVRRIEDEERQDGLLSYEYYQKFAVSVEGLRQEMRRRISGMKKCNERIVAYGAAAKGSILLNYFDIGPDDIPYIADINPHKQGKFLPGNHIPVVSPEKIRETRPEYVLIIPWNLKNEIMEQLSFISEWNGKFMLAIPRIEVIASGS